MAKAIALEPRLDGRNRKAQLKTRIPPGLKRDVALVALERRRPLCAEIEEAIRAHVVRVRQEQAERAAQDYAALA